MKKSGTKIVSLKKKQTERRKKPAHLNLRRDGLGFLHYYGHEETTPSSSSWLRTEANEKIAKPLWCRRVKNGGDLHKT